MLDEKYVSMKINRWRWNSYKKTFNTAFYVHRIFMDASCAYNIKSLEIQGDDAYISSPTPAFLPSSLITTYSVIILWEIKE